jgi:hypothetical protein
VVRRGEGPGAGAWLGGLVLGATPMLRPLRYRIRLRHPAAARASDAIADRMLPLLLVVALLFFVVGIRPGMDPAFRLFWIGSAFGLLTGVPYVIERRRLRRRLRVLPAVAEPLEELARALPLLAEVEALRRGDTAPALAEAARRERDDLVGLRLGAMADAVAGDTRGARARSLRALQLDPGAWEVASQTGLQLCRGGRFGEGIRLLERGEEVSAGHHRAELMLAHGYALAGRLREAVEALDHLQGR